VARIAELAGLMGNKPIFIADGHHRYETACNYRDQLYDAGLLRTDHPAHYVLTHFVAMEDPGLLVLPTHRLFRGLPPLRSEALQQQLGEYFTTRSAGEGPQQAHAVWEDVETAGDQGTIGLYTAADRRWIIASITAAGRAKMAELAAEHSPEWQGLGVAILHKLVVKLLYGDIPLPKPEYLHLVSEVVDGLGSDQFPVAALVMPATVDQVREISMHGERMPAKSTYFYPKLLTGLVINPLE